LLFVFGTFSTKKYLHLNKRKRRKKGNIIFNSYTFLQKEKLYHLESKVDAGNSQNGHVKKVQKNAPKILKKGDLSTQK
jgi:hypothetical protein